MALSLSEKQTACKRSVLLIKTTIVLWKSYLGGVREGEGRRKLLLATIKAEMVEKYEKIE